MVTGLAIVALLGFQRDVRSQVDPGTQIDPGTQVARIGDFVVTFEDVEEAFRRNDGDTRIRMLQQLYDARRRTLDLVIGDHLIEREAEARGMSRDELLAAELPSRTLPITDEEVQFVYDQNRDFLGDQTLDEARAQVVAAIEQQRPGQALREFISELRLAADDIVLTVDTLGPPRQQVEVLPEDPSRGPSDAPVVVVEFSDFQCPFCQRATVTLDELFDRYDGQIRFVYKDYPLPNHPDAFKAAEAGNCAHEQGKFWEFHDKMFLSQDALDVPSLNEYAAELGLDAPAFATCLDEDRYADRVRRDLQVGQQYGVSSTPTVFINGRQVLGAAPFETFDEIVREEIDSARR